MNLRRFFKHLASPPWAVRRALSAAALAELESAIKASETTHRGELRLVVEGSLDLRPLLHEQSARDRALELFSQLRVWDTAENNGVLVYLLLADRQVEIVADRGLHERTGSEAWSTICARMEAAFRRGDFKGGLQDGLRDISAILVREYPAGGANPNELPDAPVVLR